MILDQNYWQTFFLFIILKFSAAQATTPYTLLACLFTRSKQKWLFWKAGFYPANQSNLKSFQKVLT